MIIYLLDGGEKKKKSALFYVTVALAVGVPRGNKAHAVK